MKKKACKPLQDMTLLDNFLFREAMNVPELFNILVDIFMEKHVEFKDKPQTEKVFSILPELKGIRVDVFNESIDKRIYSIEMQGKDTKNLPKRSRSYQSLIDVRMLNSGEADFNDMNDIYLIIICPFDLFGKEACRYTFYEVCEEYPDLKLEDGGCRMFINTKGKNRHEFSKEFVELLDYISAPVEKMEQYTTTEPLKRLHEGIQKLKWDGEVNSRYMQLWEEIAEYKKEAREDGLAEGREEGRICAILDVIKSTMEKLSVSLEIACDLAGITTEEYEKYSKMYK